jgi:hypothetical protein
VTGHSGRIVTDFALLPEWAVTIAKWPVNSPKRQDWAWFKNGHFWVTKAKGILPSFS